VLTVHTLDEAFDLGIGAFAHGVIARFLNSFKNLAGILQIQKLPG
jgi:hypothetical protein